MTEQTIKPGNVDKKALMALMLKQKGIVAPQQTTITHSANGGPLPLSMAQERIWSLYNLDPSSSAYHIEFARRLIGPLDKVALQKALQGVAERHDILRSAFPDISGQPQQLLNPNFTFPMLELDLSHLSTSELTTATREAIAEFQERPFDLGEGPLVRSMLIVQGPESHVLLLVFHQIMFDGGSGGIFWQEMTSLYDAFVKGETADLPPLSIQYADYTLWYQNRLTPENVEPQRKYWQDRLNPAYKPLSLPVDHPRPAREKFVGKAIDFNLSADLVKQVRQFSQRQGTTVFNTLLTGFKALLHLYSNQDDIIVFTSSEGRIQPQLKPLIGLFGRQLPLRTKLDSQSTFKNLLSQVGQVVQDAFANQDIPFSELVEMIRLESGYSPAALFQAMFIFLSESSASNSSSGLQMEPLPSEKKVAKFDWRLLIIDQESAIKGRFEYKVELFDDETAVQVPHHFEQLLTAVVQNPDQILDTFRDILPEGFGRSDAQQQQAPGQKVFIAPRDRAELEMKQIWEETLGIAPIGVHDDFFEMGGHSLLGVSLMARIEESTGRKLPLTTLMQAPTIEQMAALIGNNQWEKYSSSLIPIKKGKKNLKPFFFVPPAGTTVLKYASLTNLVHQDQPFYGLQPLGLEEGETPIDKVEELAKYYLKDVQAFQAEGPYLLGGQCFGGLVAFEMARQLKKQGQEVALVAIIDTELPPMRPEKESNGKFSFGSAAQKIVKLPWNTYVFFRKTYKRTTATRMWAHKNPLYLFKNIAIWQRYSRTLQAHLDARINYVISDKYPGHISLLKFSSSNHEQKNQRWQWSDLAGGGIDSKEIPSDDESRANGEFVKQFHQWLQSHLEEAQEKISHQT